MVLRLLIGDGLPDDSSRNGTDPGADQSPLTCVTRLMADDRPGSRSDHASGRRPFVPLAPAHQEANGR